MSSFILSTRLTTPSKLIGIFALLLLTGCGPDAREVGATLLALFPIFAALLFLPSLILNKIFRQDVKIKDNPRNQITLKVSALLSIVAVCIGAWAGPDLDVSSVFLLCVGPTSLALGHASWLVGQVISPKRLYGIESFFLTMFWLFIPAIVFIEHKHFNILMTDEAAHDAAFTIWGVIGAYGLSFLILIPLTFGLYKAGVLKRGA